MNRPELSDPASLPEVSAPAAPVAPASIVRDRLIYRPASWFEPFDPVAMFGRHAPLEVELGSGDGSFLIEWARRHPNRNFLGVERLLGRIRKLDRKGQRAGLGNLLGVRIEASYFLEYLLPEAGVEALHVYFPDPWPKRRHHKNRLVNERFVALAHRILQPGGVVHLRTDNEDYFAQMQAVFAPSSRFAECATPEELAGLHTDFERDFHAQGIATRRVSYRSVAEMPPQSAME